MTNLKIQPDNCEFLRKEVAYLDPLIPKEEFEPNPCKVEGIQKFQNPNREYI